MKLLAWNIQAGGGSRVSGIASRIAKAGVHTAVLSEFRNNESGVRLRNYLLKAGYRYQAVTHSEKNENSVIMVSQYPFDSVLFPDADEVFSGNIVMAKFPAFNVVGGYFPHKKKHKLFEYVTKMVAEDDTPYIIGGDFNTGKNHIDQKGNSFWYTDRLEALEKVGYVDAFRWVNGDVEEYSWFSHQGNGFRYDHIYVKDILRDFVKDCYYNHEWRIEKMSDHAPMFLELGV